MEQMLPGLTSFLPFHPMTLTFHEDVVIYAEKKYPVGTLAAMALNIPKTVVDALALQGNLLRSVPDDARAAAFGEAEKVIRGMIRMISAFPPFHVFSESDWMGRCFSPEVFPEWQKCAASPSAMTENVRFLIGIISLFSGFGQSLASFHAAALPFAENMDKPGSPRTPIGYAEAFQKQLKDSENTAVPCSKLNLRYEVSADGSFVRRLRFSNIGDLLLCDFFEGLSHGHAPKKCRYCGRWFLTVNARHTKYCGFPAPGDAKNRTCRQLGSSRGGPSRELAEDHPLRLIYRRSLDTARHAEKRGSLDRRAAAVIKALARDKLERALCDPDYANSAYPIEMQLSLLRIEAQNKIIRDMLGAL